MTSILPLVVLLGCSRTSKVETTSDGNFKLTPESLAIQDVRTEDWKVGKNFATTIHKGFILSVSLPELTADDAEVLWKTRKIDSWFVRLFRLGNMGHEVMYQIAVPYGAAKSGRFEKGRLNKLTLNIYYAAASMSTRLANLQCPAMNHRFILSDYKIVDEQPSFKVMTIGSGDENNPNGQVENFNFGKIVVNGGASLRGNYSVELAFFSTQERKIKSSAIGYPQQLVISKESEIDIEGCLPENVPVSDPDQQKSIEQFKFGR